MKLIVELEDYQVDRISKMVEYDWLSGLDRETYDAVIPVLEKVVDKAKENGWRPKSRRNV